MYRFVAELSRQTDPTLLIYGVRGSERVQRLSQVFSRFYPTLKMNHALTHLV